MPKFVTAYDTTNGAEHLVPERWLDHPVLGQSFRKTPLPNAVDPDSDTPTKEWTVAQLEGYAGKRGIDLGGASKKADILAAIHNPNAPAAGDENQE